MSRMSQFQKITITALIILAESACTKTLVLPFYGLHSGRPKSGNQKFGIDAKTGLQAAPQAQGIVGEMRDEDGNVINSIPKSSTSKEVSAVADLGLKWAPRYSIGAGSRGSYAIFDILSSRQTTWSISPSYLNRESDQTLKSCEDDDRSDEETCKDLFSVKFKNYNLSTFFSFTATEAWWHEFTIYGGLGVSHVEIEIYDIISKSKETGKATVPTVLAGLVAKYIIFDFVFERGMTRIWQRNGRLDDSYSWLIMAGISIDVF